MRHLGRLSSLLFLLFATLLTVQAGQAPQPTKPSTPKKRIAVLDFEYATLNGPADAFFGTRQLIGRGIADLLVERLVKTGRYAVIERKAVQDVLREQNFGAGERVDAATAAKIGRILGVDALVFGSITAFGADDQNTRNAGLGGAVAGRVPVVGGVSVGRDKASSVVGLTYRLVDTETGEILDTGRGRGFSKRESSSLLLGGLGGVVFGGGNRSTTARNNRDTIYAEAVTQAVGEVADQLADAATDLPQRRIAVNGLVADVTGSIVVVNVGRTAGVNVGDRLQVSRVTKVIKDPDTDKVIHTMTEKIGEVTVTEISDDAAVGTFSGTELPRVKDRVTRR